MSSPTQRTLAWLREQGYAAQVVERDILAVELTHGTILVDAADAWVFEGTRWSTSWSGRNNYVIRVKRGTRQYLHRVLMRAGRGQCVDHINRDTLDNRRANLRLCTRRENTLNSRARGGASQFKGVAWHPRLKRWTARIMVDGKNLYLGLFASEEDAAKAYNAAAREHFGEFAWLNPV